MQFFGAVSNDIIPFIGAIIVGIVVVFGLIIWFYRKKR